MLARLASTLRQQQCYVRTGSRSMGTNMHREGYVKPNEEVEFEDFNYPTGETESELDGKSSSKKVVEPIVRVQEIDSKGRAYGTGRRKNSVARVWVSPKSTPFVEQPPTFLVNSKPLAEYFNREKLMEDIIQPFITSDALGKFNVKCTVQGGGLSGQAGAIRHGISRALEKYDPAYRPELKKAGFMTRDPRMVERKKAGQPKARKKFQWVKR